MTIARGCAARLPLRAVHMIGRALLLATLLLPGLALPASAQVGAWTAAYFNNPDLAGQPVLVRSEAAPRGNWDAGAPHASVPADHFSAHWTTHRTLPAGVWQLSAQADDGVRVLVNGAAVIDEWRATGSALFQRELELAAGTYEISVEYLERDGKAHLIFNMDPLLPPPPPDAPRARITARFLNMRDQPGIHGEIVEIISHGQVLPVVGRNRRGTWLELAFGELNAWVNARYVEAHNLGTVAITDGSAAPVSGVGATVLAAALNLRDLPNAQTGARLLRIREGERYPVLGRSPDGAWLWLQVDGITGWAHGDWLEVQPGLEGLPVLPVDVVLSSATVTADYLNLRAAPARDAQILRLLAADEVYAALGRDAAGAWVQLNVAGTIGWVSSAWVRVLPDLDTLPLTAPPGDSEPPPTATPTPTPATFGEVTVTADYLNLRSRPTRSATVLRVLTQGSRYPALGRDAAGAWLQIDVAGTIGWVSSAWVLVTTTPDALPVTG